MDPAALYDVSGDDPTACGDALDAATAALARGELVLVPTETVYGVAARSDRPEARARLERLKDGRSGPYSHAIASLADAPAPTRPWPSLLRIVDRWWPGPVTLVVDAPDGGTVGLRVPGLAVVRALAERAGVPLLLPSANRPGEAAPSCLEDVPDDVRAACAVVLDGGRAALGEASSVVRAWPGLLRVLREGVITTAELAERAAPIVLVVCSGNTCRSPMAERLLAAEFASAAEADGALVVPTVVSAGTFAGPGQPASSHAVDALAARGLSLDGHHSRPVDEALAESADVILTMTRDHAAALLSASPGLADRVQPFDPDGRDVDDPFGGSREVYERCAAALATMAERRVAALLETRSS